MANANGIDSSVLEDLDLTFRERTDVGNLLEDVYKLCTTPSARVQLVDGVPQPILFWEDPPVSFDLRDYLCDSVAPSVTAAIGQRIEQAYEDDPRFAALTAQATYDGAAQTLSVDVRGRSADGENFSAVFTADSNAVRIERTS